VVSVSSGDDLSALGWAGANRAAQALCGATFTTGLFDGGLYQPTLEWPFAKGAWLVCLGQDVRVSYVSDQEVALSHGDFQDESAASRRAAELCQAHLGQHFTGFFTGATGSEPETHELACVPLTN
jgi:hypothetical protein